MKFKDFKKGMKKQCFTWEEAEVVAFDTHPSVLKLQLYQWRKSGELISLKRGVYAFADASPSVIDVAQALYHPCYISLEYALNHYGLIPDIPFAVTLVTTKQTRKFTTPLGQFLYQKIKKEAFIGYDPKTLFAESEKALVDYLYLNNTKLIASKNFWDGMRWQNLETVNFKRAAGFARRFGSKKLNALLVSLKNYAKSN
jgi:predicted transcriptional regulator of viral defense system